MEIGIIEVRSSSETNITYTVRKRPESNWIEGFLLEDKLFKTKLELVENALHEEIDNGSIVIKEQARLG